MGIALYPTLPSLASQHFETPKPTAHPVTEGSKGSFEDMSKNSTSEFAAWCMANGFPIHSGPGSFEAFIIQKDLETRPTDEQAYPGLSHAAQLFQEHFDHPHYHFPREPQLAHILNRKYAKASMAEHFGIGKTVGGIWTITSVLAGAEGSYNRGVYLVQNNDTYSTAVLKLLPTEAMFPSFARREITILAGLKHPNILQMLQGEVPNTPHDTPWMITELCDKKTLKDLLRKYIAAQRMVPGLFVFQIFESLARALKYCHHGDPASNDWDPVSHRDLIPGNCFIKFSRTSNPVEYPYTIVAGDFGCAVTQFEYVGQGLTPHDLPYMDSFYVPPGGPSPSEANDVYQLGLLMSCFYCLEELPSMGVTNFANEKWHQGYRSYSEDLRHFIASCLESDPRRCPTASDLVKSLQAKRRVLLADGLLTRVAVYL